MIIIIEAGKAGRWGISSVTVTLYLDVFFLVNFGMDYMLLALVGRLLHLAASRRRLAAASLAGAVWACLDLMIPELDGWAELLVTWLGIGGMMVILAFGSKSSLHVQTGGKGRPGRIELTHIGSCLVTFWLVSVMAGGIFGALGDQTPAGVYLSGTRAVRQWPLLPWCFLVAGIYFGICAGIRLVKRKAGEQKLLCRVKLFYRGKELVVTALWDTGNRLYEPYGNQPVHVVTKQVSLKLCRSVPQLIYIPFRTVGEEYGMMPGIRIDAMEVEREGNVIRRYDRPWLAISKRPLSLENRYEMLLHGSER